MTNRKKEAKNIHGVVKPIVITSRKKKELNYEIEDLPERLQKVKNIKKCYLNAINDNVISFTKIKNIFNNAELSEDDRILFEKLLNKRNIIIVSESKQPPKEKINEDNILSDTGFTKRIQNSKILNRAEEKMITKQISDYKHLMLITMERLPGTVGFLRYCIYKMRESFSHLKEMCILDINTLYNNKDSTPRTRKNSIKLCSQNLTDIIKLYEEWSPTTPNEEIIKKLDSFRFSFEYLKRYFTCIMPYVDDTKVNQYTKDLKHIEHTINTDNFQEEKKAIMKYMWDLNCKKLEEPQILKLYDDLFENYIKFIQRVILMMKANYRLVVSVAKKYSSSCYKNSRSSDVSLNFFDYVLEGVHGLRKALEKYNWEIGYKMSTYASWWISQGINRIDVIKNLFRTPAHFEAVKKDIKNAQHAIESKKFSSATNQDIADYLSISVDQVYKTQQLDRKSVSFNNFKENKNKDHVEMEGNIVAEDQQDPDKDFKEDMQRQNIIILIHNFPLREILVFTLRSGAATMSLVSSIISIGQEQSHQAYKLWCEVRNSDARGMDYTIYDTTFKINFVENILNYNINLKNNGYTINDILYGIYFKKYKESPFHTPPTSLDHIANFLNITKERVRQLYDSIISTITAAINVPIK